MKIYPKDIAKFAVAGSIYLTAHLTEIGSKYADFPQEEIMKTVIALSAVETGDYTNPYLGSNLNRVSSADARGIVQIKPRTKNWIETKFLKIPNTDDSKLFDPEYNIRIAMMYLIYQYKRYGSIDKAIISYHDGNANNIDNVSREYLRRAKKSLSVLDWNELNLNLKKKMSLAVVGITAILTMILIARTQ